MVNDGMPIIAQGGRGRGDHSLFDSVACMKWWRDRLPGLSEKEHAQLREMELDIQLKQQKLDEQRELLISRDDVIRHGQAYTKGWATELLAFARVAVQHGLISPDQEPAVAGQCRDLATRISSWKSVEDIEHRIEAITSESAA